MSIDIGLLYFLRSQQAWFLNRQVVTERIEWLDCPWTTEAAFPPMSLINSIPKAGSAQWHDLHKLVSTEIPICRSLRYIRYMILSPMLHFRGVAHHVKWMSYFLWNIFLNICPVFTSYMCIFCNGQVCQLCTWYVEITMWSKVIWDRSILYCFKTLNYFTIQSFIVTSVIWMMGKCTMSSNHETQSNKYSFLHINILW